ncbi:MAG: hypothetical protein KDC44_11135, partial [Phaeodactylibacter sp.]|nr:hypothetical protein [Phaeodactylibacter sp.]
MQPFRSLAAAISQYEVLYDRKIAPSFQEELESRLQSNKNTLTDLYLQSDYARKFNYLLVVDPVDELQKGRISDLEKRLFIDVLLRAARHPEANFYLVFSVSNKLLNSEDLYPEMREIVDANAYFLNTLSQVDLEQAIRRPIESFGYQIEEELCNLLIDKLSFDAEQLPKLQQALQGTWMAWEKDGMNGPLSKKHYSKGTGSKEIHARVKGEDKPEPGQEKLVLNKEKGAQKLTIGSAEPAEKSPLLQKIQAKKGTAKSTPSSEDDRQPEEVADAIFFALTPQEQQQAIRIFKSLAFIQPGEDDPKLRSLELESLADILGTDLKTTAQIASRFDKGPFTFIQVSGRDETPDAVVSIGELDILQNWDRLQQWMMEEQQDLAIYREIVQFAERFFIEDDREALWEGEILEDALNWRDRKHLNEHWAALYESQNNFPLAMQFLKESYENSQLSRSDTLKSTPEPEPEPTPP